MLTVWDKPEFLLLLTSKVEEEMEKTKPILQRTLHWNKPYAHLRGEKEARLHILEDGLYFLKTGIGFVMTACRIKGHVQCLNPPLANINLFFPQHRPNH